jgi:formylglycine-generating enzyme required for sulfatase activity
MNRDGSAFTMLVVCLSLVSCTRVGFWYAASSSDSLPPADSFNRDLFSDGRFSDNQISDGRYSDSHLNDSTPGNDRSVSHDIFISNEASFRDQGPKDATVVLPITWVTIKAGSFSMGSPEDEPCRETNETQHSVTLTHDFEIPSTEIINEVLVLLFPNASPFCPECKICDNTPLLPTYQTWDRAALYCNALSMYQGLPTCYLCAEQEVTISCDPKGKRTFCEELPEYRGGNIYKCPGYRLPTEAEWEYAYRAGITTALYSGAVTTCSGSDSNADMIAWYDSNAGSKIHEGGQKAPNAWNLYDMAGNMEEWVNDLYEEDLGQSAVTDPGGPETATLFIPHCSRPGRVIKGGSWVSLPGQLRAAARSFATSTMWAEVSGFRCARTLLQ